MAAATPPFRHPAPACNCHIAAELQAPRAAGATGPAPISLAVWFSFVAGRKAWPRAGAFPTNSDQPPARDPVQSAPFWRSFEFQHNPTNPEPEQRPQVGTPPGTRPRTRGDQLSAPTHARTKHAVQCPSRHSWAQGFESSVCPDALLILFLGTCN